MRYGSLFTGVGGFDLGFDRAGMTCAWQVERDAQCRAVLERHWPGVERYEDVRNVGAELAAVDLICGGFPCQDLSVAGRRAGLAGERSGLWHEFHRIVTELTPQWVVIENVPGLLSSNGGRDFAVILRGLVECGYGVAWRVLDSQYFGVAQRRRRVFIVGHLGTGAAAQVLFEREGVPGNPAPGREARPGFAVVSGTLSANRGGTERPAGNANELDFCIPVAYGGGNRSNPYPVGVRRLTPLECERLQGFPDCWTDGQSDAARYRQMGNAVTVPVIEWLGRRIMAAVEAAQ